MNRRQLFGAFPWALAAPAVHSADAAPLKVMASFSILADLVREVAGDAAVVGSLVGANADAHVFEPTPTDVQRLAQADIVVVNGLGFEGWLERLVKASGARATMIVATQGIAPRKLGPAPDPHAWQSLVQAARYVDNIRAALAAARPALAGGFTARAAAYRDRLAALDRRAHQRFDALEPARRIAITSHDAFGYFGDAYGIRFIAPRGWTTDAEPSASQVAAMIRQVKLLQARALFVENISDKRLIQRIAQDTGATVGATLYSDALSAPGTAADTYLHLYAHNVDAVADALGAPAAPAVDPATKAPAR